LNKLFFTIALITTTALSCNAQENTPKISTPTKINYTYEVFVDSLDIPWGMSFINENDLLVTEKSGILYRIKNGIKKKVKILKNFNLFVIFLNYVEKNVNIFKYNKKYSK